MVSDDKYKGPSIETLRIPSNLKDRLVAAIGAVEGIEGLIGLSLIADSYLKQVANVMWKFPSYTEVYVFYSSYFWELHFMHDSTIYRLGIFGKPSDKERQKIEEALGLKKTLMQSGRATAVVLLNGQPLEKIIKKGHKGIGGSMYVLNMEQKMVYWGRK